jgi:hypothetical protein
MLVSFKADGLLRHHFWGDCCATIGLWFLSSAAAEAALSLLGDGWKVSPKDPKLLIGTFSGEALDTAENTLAKFGASRAKMTSIATSIDHGEVFTVNVEGDYIPPEQGSLF